MRIVVVGATGNVGSAILRRLHSEDAVSEIVGVARREPDASAAPYSGATWHAIDVGSARAVSRLTDVFAGADAVIHLAWLLQPNRHERTMWHTNVAGTAHVLEAVARAGVPQVVIASSVGAYSGAPKNRRAAEEWPTGGLHTSHYSRHKAINERAFDAFELDHPEILLTRIRPGLVFQQPAASEIARLFVGRLIPLGLLTRLDLPVLPLPKRLVFQAVHADDLASAFWLAIQRRTAGAFNIAAEPVLNPQRIAGVLGAGGVAPLNGALLRLVVWATWKLRLQRTDPGWIDIALNVPVMSTDKARELLGWAPERSATDALREIIEGFQQGTDVPASPPLRSTDTR